MNANSLGGAEMTSSPYGYYAMLRDTRGLHWLEDGHGGGVWLASRYDDALAMLRAGQVSKEFSRVMPPHRITAFGRCMANQEGAEHHRLKSAVVDEFSSRTIREWEPSIVAHAEATVAAAARQGTVDVVTDIASHFSAAVLGELIGIPREDDEQVRRWAAEIATVDGMSWVRPQYGRSSRIGMKASDALERYCAALIQAKRVAPGDDFISRCLARGSQHHDGLSDDDLTGACAMLVVAGLQTTTHLIGSGVLALLRHREHMDYLACHRDELSWAVEEIVRMDSPIQRSFFRIATDALEIAGQPIAKGENVCAAIGSANRDPAVFAEPDVFNIHRRPNPHLAFGVGTHFCLGAALARAEARIAFGVLLDYPGTIELATDRIEWDPNPQFRALRALPVRFNPA